MSLLFFYNRYITLQRAKPKDAERPSLFGSVLGLLIRYLRRSRNNCVQPLKMLF